MSAQFFPVAIGGVGGSGTRVVARIVAAMGYHIGSDLNQSSDNLTFTLLFKRREIVEAADQEINSCFSAFRSVVRGEEGLRIGDDLERRLLSADRPGQHGSDWLIERIARARNEKPNKQYVAWGWKEPNTHIVIDRLAKLQPDLRYIHVVRNGLDMAFSANQNQLRLWGDLAFGSVPPICPRSSLAFWRWAHQRIEGILRGALSGRSCLIRLEDLIRQPRDTIVDLADLLSAPQPPSGIESLASLVETPRTLQRYRGYDMSQFDQRDIEFVQEMGFRID